MVVAYVTSRFPEVTETWIVRELDALTADKDVECHVLSLFPPQTTVVHPAAQRWLADHRRPGVRAAAGAVAWWLRRSPGCFLVAVAMVIAGYLRRPRTLARALTTLPIAAAHARFLAAGGIDHVHAHFATYPLLTAWLCHRLTGVGYSFTAHAHDIFVDQSFLRTRLAAADFAVAISDFNRGFLAAYGGDRATPVHVVRMGLDLSAYQYRPRAAGGSRAVRALCVGRLKEEKGHRVLLEALARAGSDLERVSVDFVGDGPLRGELEALAGSLGLRGRVRFHGALPEHRVTDLFDGADLFVLPSKIKQDGTMEGLPVVLVEALACGVPAVATRMSGVPELIRDGDTGWLAEPGSAADLGRAIAEALADETETLRRVEAGRALVERNHDVRRSAAALRRLLQGRDATADRRASAARVGGGPRSGGYPTSRGASK